MCDARHASPSEAKDWFHGLGASPATRYKVVIKGMVVRIHPFQEKHRCVMLAVAVVNIHIAMHPHARVSPSQQFWYPASLMGQIQRIAPAV